MPDLLISLLFWTFRILLLFYDVITFPLYALYTYLADRRAGGSSSNLARKKARVVSRSAKEVTYRCVPSECALKDEIIRHPDNINTLAKLFNFIAKRVIHAERQEKAPNGKVLEKLSLGEYLWLRYSDLAKYSDEFGQGLRAIGVEPREKVCIFADTRAEWLISAIGCFKQSIALATVYTNLGDDGVEHCVNQTKAQVILTTQELLPRIIRLQSRMQTIQAVVYFESQTRPRPDSPMEGLRLYSYTEIVTRGSRSRLACASPFPEDTAIVMYTSGSTGVPKGVVISHANIINGILSILPTVTRAVHRGGPITSSDTYIAFLPLAHVLELLAEHVMLLIGVKVGYSSPYTLVDKSTAICKGEKGDASVLKPSIMAAVPLILDRIYKNINKNIEERGAFTRKLIDFAVPYKMRWAARGYDTPIMNKLLFAKMREVVGGRLRIMLSGGAPLAEDVHEFVQACLNIILLQGYGLTETTSTACITDPYDETPGHVGPPLEGVDLKLVDWEEGGYTVRDPAGPRGEIVIGGYHVSQGYFNMPEKTREDFFMEDGKQFFRTGDIGHLLPDGSVKIIDRKKDLVKLQYGEYVSLGKVESNMKIHPLVESICVYADSTQTAVVALVVPDDETLNEVAKEQGRSPSSLTREQLCKDPLVCKSALETLTKHAQRCALEKFEIPKAITLLPEQWTPDTGLVTAAFKLRRKPIQQRYLKHIDSMYEQLRLGPDTAAVAIPNKDKLNKVGVA